MAKKPSNLPYVLAGLAALAVIIAAWVGRDRLGARAVQASARAPAFEAMTLDGQPASLADFEGQVVLLNIWATWCAPCRVEMPSMERLYHELKDEEFEIVAVSVDAPIGQADSMGIPGGDIGAFAESLSLTFPILHDPEGRIQRIYQTTGVPESFVIGRDGVIQRKLLGPTEWDRAEYLDFFHQLLEEGG